MMAVDIATQPSFAAGKPRMLFEGQYVPAPVTFPNYDVSPDGQRFLMLKPIERFFASAARLLKPGGTLAIIDWFKKENLKQAEHKKFIQLKKACALNCRPWRSISQDRHTRWQGYTSRTRAF
jgi:hypothetical protein